MVTVAKTKMMVKPASRILSAISFGVFWRSAPSTSLIMRSRKVEPSAAVMRTRIQSESTCVPPVTAERSPPDFADDRRGLTRDRCLIDGGDALDHLTVGRDDVACLDHDHVADFQAGAGNELPALRALAAVNSLACVSVRWRRSVSACAFPRPSAMASAKLANRTVNHSQRMIWNSKAMLAPPVMRSRTRMTVVKAVTTSSTNITGFFISVRGLSLTKAEPMAGKTILGSNKAETGIRLRICEVSIEMTPR